MRCLPGSYACHSQSACCTAPFSRQPRLKGKALAFWQAAAQEGNTAPPPLEEVVNLHFVALVHRDGRLWELDGRKSFPIDHGPTSPERLLQVCWTCLSHLFKLCKCSSATSRLAC